MHYGRLAWDWIAEIMFGFRLNFGLELVLSSKFGFGRLFKA